MSIPANFSLKNLWKKVARGDKKRSQPPPPPDWEPWEFDLVFFEELAHWNEEHPQNTFQKIFNKINTGVQRVQPLFEAIPDSPFPARGIVKALGYLVILGSIVARAKADVQEFALQTVQWITEMTEAFKVGRVSRGSFNWRTKRNLEKRSTLIHEICTWAAARLHDQRWEQIIKGMAISAEIAQFRHRLEEARALFMDLSVVNLSQGIDKMFKEQIKISQEIKQVRKIQQKQLRQILETLETQQQAEERRRFMNQILQPQVVVNSTYNEQGKQPCDPETRVDILANIHTWIKDLTPNSKRFFWLTGDPGSGKSAITASIAKDCKDEGILWAQFFINRNSADTTNPKSYFPSIACQLADHYPGSEVALAIHDALKRQQSLVDDISAEQAMKLFADAVEVAGNLDLKTPVVIVIDGLDESEHSRLVNTAKIFSSLFQCIRCPNVKIFISSRTDDEIRRSFAQANHVQYVEHVHLDTAERSSIRDVSTFLTRRIGDIVEENDLNWDRWPGQERMEALCVRASGLFIWAVTSAKFFQEQIKLSGTEGLNELLDALSSDGLGDINVLYGTILKITYEGATAWAFEKFRRIVGCLVVLQEPLSIKTIGDMLDLRKTKDSDPVDLVNFFRRLRTVLVAGADVIDENTIPRLHKSFFEFITSERAESRFRVNIELSDGETAIQCLRRLSTFHDSFDSSTFPTPISVSTAVLYAARFWQSHLSHSERAPSGIAVVPGSLPLHVIRTSLQSRGPGKALNVTFLSNRYRVLTSWGGSVQVWDGLSGKPTELPGFEGHKTWVRSFAFSPDGMRGASGSADCTVRVWDAQTGKAISSPFRGHTKAVSCLAFSSDGTLIVSGSDDKTVRLWDVQSGKPIGPSFDRHTKLVTSVALSPDGTRVVSSSHDGSVYIRDVANGKVTASPVTWHGYPVFCVAFSPNGKFVATGSGDSTIQFFDAQSGEAIGSPLKGHTGGVVCIAFSLDGARIVSGDGECIVRAWNLQTGGSIGVPFRQHTNVVRFVAFSPDGSRVFSGCSGKPILVWDVKSGQVIYSPLFGNIHSVSPITFSPDGSRIAKCFTDHTIRILDSQTGQFAQLQFKGHMSFIAAFAARPRAAIATSECTVQVVDLGTVEFVGAPLISNLADISSIDISPDEKFLAAVDSVGKICLWDMVTRKISSHAENLFGGLILLSFSPNGSQIILSRVDGAISRWAIKDGKLKLVDTFVPSSDALLPQNNKVISFDMEKGWQHEPGDVDGQQNATPSLQWVPFDDRDAGLWAYVDGKLIRGNGVDSVSIFDVGADAG